MARPRISEQRQRAAFVRSGQRMIAQGGRPLYRVGTAQDGRWVVDGCPWLPLTATNRHEALAAARATLSEPLDVGPDVFDVETLV